MWGKLNNINKWKDMAVDMVAPRTHGSHHDGSDEDENDTAGVLRHAPPRQQQQPAHPNSAQLQIARRDSHDDPHADATTTRSLDGWMHERKQLLSRIAELEDDKERVVLEAQQYSKAVKQNHEDTVKYYEAKCSGLEQEWQEKLRVVTEEANRVTVEATSLVSSSSTPHAPSTQHGASTIELEEKVDRLTKEVEAKDATLKEVNQKLRDAYRSSAASREKLTEMERRIQELQETHAAELVAAQLMMATTATSSSPSIAENAANVVDDKDRIDSAAELLRVTNQFRVLQMEHATQLQQVQQRMKTAESTATTLQSTLTSKTEECDALRAQVSEAQSRQHELTSSYESEVARRANAEQVLAALQASVAAQQASHREKDAARHATEEELSKEVARRQRASDELQAAHTQTVAALEASTIRWKSEAESLQRRLDSECSKQSFGEETVSNMRGTVDMLQGECKRLRDAQEAAHREALSVYQGITLRPTATSGGGAVAPNVVVTSSVDMLKSVARELSFYQTAVQEAQATHKQWELTYNKAKEVNQTVQKQLQDAQRQIQELRMELTLRDKTLQELQTKSKQDTERWQHAQVNISSQHQSQQRFEVERSELQSQIAALKRDKDLTAQTIQDLHAELDVVRGTLQEKEEELTTSQRSAQNLQMVLEQFQLGKQREVEERTSYLQHELDGARAEAAAVETLRHRHREDIEEIHRTHRKDLASKNVSISGLQGKLGELKRVLEETTAQLSDEHMIDKRVVSHLVVNFVHSVALNRGDSDDMLKVMSGLLNWDELTQQRAGLLPGPLNPRRNPSSLVGGLVRSVWGGGGGARKRAAANLDESQTSGDNGGGAKSISEMWVDFLIKEAAASNNNNASVPGPTESEDFHQH